MAQECLKVKNYSSLRAIVSGLQTHGIHRLKRTWSCVSTDLVSQLSQIQGISKESNHSVSSIPYLGHVLTDLMMVDAAYPDKLEDGRLINFEKRRKEYDLMRMIEKIQKSNQVQPKDNPKYRLSASFLTWIGFIQVRLDQTKWVD